MNYGTVANGGPPKPWRRRKTTQITGSESSPSISGRLGRCGRDIRTCGWSHRVGLARPAPAAEPDHVESRHAVSGCASELTCGSVSLLTNLTRVPAVNRASFTPAVVIVTTTVGRAAARRGTRISVSRRRRRW